MIDTIYQWWLDNASQLCGDYGDIVAIIFTIITIVGMFRIILIYPLYILGSRKKI